MSDFTLFALTIIPLVLTPGPDMLFVLSQAMGKDFKSGMMATFGVCSGYLVHSVLVALGISAIIVSYPMLFNAIRFLGLRTWCTFQFSYFVQHFKVKVFGYQRHRLITPFAKVL
jgi:hypothetical protein